MLGIELLNRVEIGISRAVWFFCLIKASSSSSASNWGVFEVGGQAGHPALSSQPCSLPLLSQTWGGGLQVFFSQPHPHCVLPSHMLTLFPIISSSILSPDLDIHGVRFKARWTERFFSPIIVVLLTSYSCIPWKNSGAEVPITF